VLKYDQYFSGGHYVPHEEDQFFLGWITESAQHDGRTSAETILNT